MWARILAPSPEDLVLFPLPLTQDWTKSKTDVANHPTSKNTSHGISIPTTDQKDQAPQKEYVIGVKTKTDRFPWTLRCGLGTASLRFPFLRDLPGGKVSVLSFGPASHRVFLFHYLSDAKNLVLLMPESIQANKNSFECQVNKLKIFSLFVVFICAFDLRNLYLLPQFQLAFMSQTLSSLKPHLHVLTDSSNSTCLTPFIISFPTSCLQAVLPLSLAPLPVYPHPITSDRNHSFDDFPSVPEYIWLVTKSKHLSNLTLLYCHCHLLKLDFFQFLLLDNYKMLTVCQKLLSIIHLVS